MNINVEILNLLMQLKSGKLSGKEKKAAEILLKSDAEFQIVYNLLDDLFALTSGTDEPLEDASKKLSQIMFAAYQKKLKSKNSKLGLPVYDSSLLPLPEGVRPASVDTRQLKYQFGEMLLELSLYPITIDSVEIIGQIHNIDIDQKITIQIQTKFSEYTTTPDSYQLFRFERVEYGKEKIQLKIIAKRKIIGAIDLNL